MTNTNFYKYLSFGLIALNLILIALLIIGRPNGQGPRPGKAPINFNDDQHEQFLTSVDKHKAQMSTLNNNQRDLLKVYFDKLTSDNYSDIDSVTIANILNIEKDKIESTYLHFLDVRELTDKNQKEEYEAFVEFALDRILTNSNKNRPKRKK